jgi:hypothetical protein
MNRYCITFKIANSSGLGTETRRTPPDPAGG